MLKVLLVDDEQVITQGLQALIDWAAEGYEIAAVCSNGREALDYLRENKVDLVMADVMMPEMSGLELMERVQQEKISDAGFAVLSGYSDFSFAQQALRYGCIDYLLKPVEREDLLAILRKYSSISRNNRMEEQYERAYLARRVIALLSGKYDQDSADYVSSHLDLSGGIRYIEMEVSVPEAQEEEDEELHSLQRELYRACVQILGPDGKRCLLDVSADSASRGVGFLYSGALSEAANCTEHQYISALYQRLAISVQRELEFCVGENVKNIRQLSRSYRSACGLKNLRAFRTEKKPIYYYEEELQVSQKESILCKDALDRLISAIDRNQPEQIRLGVERLFNQMQKRGVRNRDINLNLNYLLYQLLRLASDLDCEADQKNMLQFISTQAFREGISRGSSQHLFRFAREYADYLATLRKHLSTDILDVIEREVRKNYAENLTLQGLGKKYYINSSYLGQLFRKKYKQSFKNYLCAYRINEACRLLLCTDKRVGQIGEEVGYRDTDYFICKFIELKGCTPSRFRKNGMEDGE